MSDYRIGYVILHYIDEKTTINCVNSLRQLMLKDDIIIIVDNCSPNQSGARLAKLYDASENIRVVLNDENLGFAKGNNVGFAILKYNYSCNIIIMLNNDILIRQDNFREVLINEYEIHGFDICGPQILTLENKINPCSPQLPQHVKLSRIKIGQISNILRYILSFINADIWLSKKLDRNLKENNDANSYIENIQLHGCFLIFTKKYIEMFNGLNPDTYMYLEEQILYARSMINGLKIAYDPKLKVVHLEGISTDAAMIQKEASKRRFKYKCQMKSFKVLYEGIKKNEI